MKRRAFWIVFNGGCAFANLAAALEPGYWFIPDWLSGVGALACAALCGACCMTKAEN